MDIKHQSYMSLMGCCNNCSHVALYNSTGYQDIVQGSAVEGGQVCTIDLIHYSNHAHMAAQSGLSSLRPRLERDKCWDGK